MNNCGACGTACKPGEVCARAASARSRAAQGLTNCSGRVPRPHRSTGSIAAPAARRATAGQMCTAGKCVVSCGAGLRATAAASAATSTTDVANCGACGNGVRRRARCARGQVRGPLRRRPRRTATASAATSRPTSTTAARAATPARPGRCAPAASARSRAAHGLTNCNGICRDLADRRQQLRRAAATPCAAGQVCSGGKCAVSCGARPHELQRLVPRPRHRPGQLRRAADDLPAGRGVHRRRVRALVRRGPARTATARAATSRPTRSNCGACGHACGHGRGVPGAATCTLVRPRPERLQRRLQGSAASDPANCGACGKPAAMASSALAASARPSAAAWCATASARTPTWMAPTAAAAAMACGPGEVCSQGKCGLVRRRHHRLRRRLP